VATRSAGPWPKGLDLRTIADDGDPKSFRTATNVDLRTDGSVGARDGLEPVATLLSESIGLYSINGYLRSVIPAGYSLALSTIGPVPIYYDSVGDGTVYGAGTITKVIAVTSWGVDAAIGAYPYILLQRDTGRYEHHWITDTPVPNVNGAPPPPYVPSNDPVSTKVTTLQLGFEPGGAIAKTAEKIWAIDNVNGTVHFSSTTAGPRDWTKVADAGFLATLRNAVSDRLIRGLGLYDRYLAVIFSDSVQFWLVDPDPALHRLDRVMNGPGTEYPGSIVNVRGDLFYFSAGVFSSIKQSSYTGQLREGDIGAPIAPETSLLTTAPTAIWSQARSQYICAFGNDVWVYTLSETSKVMGWRKWTLSVPVEYLVEHDKQLYVRSGATLYRFNPNYVDGTSFTFETHYDHFGAPGVRKFAATVDVVMEGTATLSFMPDVRDTTQIEAGPTITGATSTQNDIPALVSGEAIATRFTGAVGGATPWVLGRLSYKYTVLGL
jgi:hypothetical protein